MSKAPERCAVARFDDLWRLDPLTGCHNWIAGGNGKGYGSLKVSGRAVRAYRFALQRIGRTIPNGKEVRHSCDNKRCVNPEHLIIGTHAENMADRRRVWTNPFGEGASHAKLTQLEVDEIRRLVAAGMLQREAADRFNTSQTNVSDIVRFKSWPEARPC